MLKKKKSPLRWIVSVAGKQCYGVALLTVLDSAVSLLTVVFALLLKGSIDGVTAGRQDVFLLYVGGLFAIVAGQLILHAFSRRVDEVVKSGLENRLKSSVYQTVLSRKYASLRIYHTGELQNRMTNDTVLISQAAATILPGFFSMAVKMCGAAVVLLTLDRNFALVFLICGVLLFSVTYAFRKVMKRLHKQVQQADGGVRSFLQETVGSLLVLRSFGGEKQAVAAAERKMEEHRNIRLKRNRFSNIANTGFGTVMNGGYLFGLVWCGFGILQGTLSVGMLTAVLQLINQIQAPFASLSGYLPRFYAMTASAERLMELEDLPADALCQRMTCEERDSFYHRLENIRIDNVTFSYPGEKNPPVLKEVSILIQKGDFVAVTGRSGTGKSTLLKLLLSVYKPEAGEVSFTLKDGESTPLSAGTRSLFAYVPQGNFLLSGELWQAIHFLSDGEVDMARIEESCRLACVDFVEDLPDGYHTVIGEKGEGLSEGQNQRLAIARAIYSQAPVLLLDESTSALDEQTERQLLHNLRELTDKTVIIVTHRPAALSLCNKRLRVRDHHFEEVPEQTGA